MAAAEKKELAIFEFQTVHAWPCRMHWRMPNVSMYIYFCTPPLVQLTLLVLASF